MTEGERRGVERVKTPGKFGQGEFETTMVNLCSQAQE